MSGRLRHLRHGWTDCVTAVRKNASPSSIVVLLLCGDDKASQARDIERAKAMAEALEE